MTPIETVQALVAVLNELRPMTAYGVVNSRDVDQARYRKAIDDALALLSRSQQAVQEPASVPTDEDILAAVRGETYVARDADEERLVVTAARAALSAFGKLTVKD